MDGQLDIPKLQVELAAKDATLAVAVLDRLTMRAICVDIDGPSYRQFIAEQRAKQRGKKAPSQND